MNREVNQYIDKINQNWQTDVCKHLRKAILQTLPDAEELLQYGKPHYKKEGKFICTYGFAKAWVNFTIFNAKSLKEQKDLFEPADGSDRRTIKIHEGQKIDYSLLAKTLLQAAKTLN
jgi:hypothetical protein